jgi:UDP-glucose 4-epimerase
VVLDNLTTGFDWAVPPGASFAIGDARDQSQVAALIAEHRVDVIFGIIFTFPISSPPTPMRLLICAVAAPTTLNCGYGRGFSVLDVIEPVKRRLQGGACGPPGRRSASPRRRLRPYPLDAQMAAAL